MSIDLTFGVGDYVRGITNSDKFGSDPMSIRDVTYGATCTGPVTFFCILLQSYSPYL